MSILDAVRRKGAFPSAKVGAPMGALPMIGAPKVGMMPPRVGIPQVPAIATPSALMPSNPAGGLMKEAVKGKSALLAALRNR